MVKSSMNRIIRNDVADGPVGNEGGRSPSALSTGHNGAEAGCAPSGPLAPGQRWSVSRKREVVLRLLRGEAAEDLSRELGVPLYKLERWRQKAEAALGGASHDRHIITEAPNLMWATDATQIITVQDGKVWLFGVVEHWNAEALGWHVAKRGDRYSAAQAVGMAVRNVFGHVSPSAARGVALRHDHGSAFLAEHFHNQIRFWGMTPSYAFVGEPETNGVVERFFRTLKEQIVHGRIYQTIDEARDAVRDFVARYNAEWLIEKNGLRSPSDARAAWYQAVMKTAA